jgi:signal transduction histidine kinase
MTLAPESEQEWRRLALRRTLLAFGALLAALGGLSLLRGLANFWLLLAGAPLAFGMAALVGRARWYRRAGVACLALMGFQVLAAMLLRGPTPGSAVGWLCFVVLSGVFFGQRAIGVAALVLVGCHLALGLAYYPGLSPVHLRFEPLDWSARLSWVQATVALVALTALTGYSVVAVLQRFGAELRERDQTLRALEAELAASQQAALARRDAELALTGAQRAQVAGRLGAAVAHELGDALVVIHGWAELLRQGAKSPEERQEAAEAITAASRRATALTRLLMSQARPSRPNEGPAEVGQVLESVGGFCARMLPADVRLTVRCAPGLRARIAAPALEQALLNLVLNARDAMQAGGTLELSAEPVPASGEAPALVRLRVADAGCGMGPEVQARLFQPFFTTKQGVQGVGLGLVSSRQLIEAAGGTLTIDTAAGQGTCVTLELPAEATQPGPSPSAGTPALVGGGGGGGGGGPARARGQRVLVVEGDEPLRQQACLALRARGFAVLEAGDPAAAVETVRRQRDALSLLFLGEGAGEQRALVLLAEEFCALYPGGQVLACAGPGDTQPLRDRLDPARLSLLLRPFRLSELIARACALASPGAEVR